VIEPFGKAALVFESLGLGSNLAIEQVAAKVDEGQGGIGREDRRGKRDEIGRTRTSTDGHGPNDTELFPETLGPLSFPCPCPSVFVRDCPCPLDGIE
jgi:hypothetical protein